MCCDESEAGYPGMASNEPGTDRNEAHSATSSSHLSTPFLTTPSLTITSATTSWLRILMKCETEEMLHWQTAAYYQAGYKREYPYGYEYPGNTEKPFPHVLNDNDDKVVEESAAHEIVDI